MVWLFVSAASCVNIEVFSTVPEEVFVIRERHRDELYELVRFSWRQFV
jgi:hypothetical protein